MTNERIIELLEIEKECIRRNSCGECSRACHICELVQDDTDLIEMYAEVIARMKAQEPRVMTATEAYTADYVYIEFDGVITPAIRTTNERDGHRESYFATQQLGGDWMRWDDYGITWRCWTSRPTDEQREKEPWNECTDVT